MKKILFVIFLMALLISCKKEVSDMQTGYFVRFYGDALDDFGSDVELKSDGGYVIAATTQGALPGTDTDIMIITTDKYGYQNSETIYYGDGDTLNEKCTGLLILEDGFVLTGSVNKGGAEPIDNLLLVKFRNDGTLEWTIDNDPDIYDRTGQGNDVALINNQIVIAGYTLSGGTQKPLFITFDLAGKKIDWDAPPKNPGGYYTSIFQKGDQVYGFATSFQNMSNTEMFLTGKGNISDIYPFPLSGNETSSKIISAENGGFFFVGTTDPVGSGFSQIVVKKLNADFSEDLTFNTNPIGSDADFRGVDIQEVEDGRIAVLGDKTLSKDTDIVLYILNPDGTNNSFKIYGKTGVQSAASLKHTPDGGLIILGNNQQEKTRSMITLIKTDKDGNIWE